VQHELTVAAAGNPKPTSHLLLLLLPLLLQQHQVDHSLALLPLLLLQGLTHCRCCRCCRQQLQRRCQLLLPATAVAQKSELDVTQGQAAALPAAALAQLAHPSYYCCCCRQAHPQQLLASAAAAGLWFAVRGVPPGGFLQGFLQGSWLLLILQGP
jgi:hypothetical protein